MQPGAGRLVEHEPGQPDGYFDNDYGQTLFLDGILMDIMVDDSEI